MAELPTLGAPPKQAAPIVPIVLTATVIGLALGGIYWVRLPLPAERGPVAPVEVEAPLPASPRVAGGGDEVLPYKTFSIDINGPLESAIIASEGKTIGAPLTQVVTRNLVWWVRVPQDLARGDTLQVAYEAREGKEPLVHAVRFTSGRHARTFEAYRFQPAGAPFPAFFQPDGSTLEERLIDGPIESWEQITSLLRDGRRHQGVDFKTPVGTPVKASFDATVTRLNWNFRGNGNSVELKERGGAGRTALYLHLQELPKTLKVGQQLKRGEVFAQSGNTGRSFAPHLHFQLMQGATVLDPFESLKTTRGALPETDKAAFEQQIATLRAALP